MSILSTICDDNNISVKQFSKEISEMEARIFAAVFTALMLWDKYRDNGCELQAVEVSA